MLATLLLSCPAFAQKDCICSDNNLTSLAGREECCSARELRLVQCGGLRPCWCSCRDSGRLVDCFQVAGRQMQLLTQFLSSRWGIIVSALSTALDWRSLERDQHPRLVMPATVAAVALVTLAGAASLYAPPAAVPGASSSADCALSCGVEGGQA